MKTILLPAFITVCFATIAFNGFSQQKQPQVNKNEEIIIRTTPSDTGKTIIEIDSNVVTINGQPLSDYNGDVTVSRRRKFMGGANGNNFFRGPQNYMNHPNTAFLGVYTAKTDKGVVINNVLDNSSAKAAGLQKDDIITKVGDNKITTPAELRNAIQAYKPGDKVTIVYLRNGKKRSVNVELSKTPSMPGNLNSDLQNELQNGFGNGNNYNFRMLPMPPQNFRNFNFNENHARLGLQIQDTEDSSGVKVQHVLPGSPSEKAGLKEGDIITEINGEKVNDVDNVMSKIHSAHHSRDFKLKVLRDKKELNFDVHIPRPLKSTDI